MSLSTAVRFNFFSSTSFRYNRSMNGQSNRYLPIRRKTVTYFKTASNPVFIVIYFIRWCNLYGRFIIWLHIVTRRSKILNSIGLRKISDWLRLWLNALSFRFPLLYSKFVLKVLLCWTSLKNWNWSRDSVINFNIIP